MSVGQKRRGIVGGLFVEPASATSHSFSVFSSGSSSSFVTISIWRAAEGSATLCRIAFCPRASPRSGRREVSRFSLSRLNFASGGSFSRPRILSKESLPLWNSASAIVSPCSLVSGRGGLAAFRDFEISHLLPDAKALREGVRPRATESLGRPCPMPDRASICRPAAASRAVDKKSCDGSPRALRRSSRDDRRLRVPNLVELIEQHLSRRIEIVFGLRAGAFVARADGSRLCGGERGTRQAFVHRSSAARLAACRPLP